MKMEECIESIFGCLERIENKINGLSTPLLEGTARQLIINRMSPC